MRPFRTVVVALLLGGLVGCSAASPTPLPAPSSAEDGFDNPVYARNFPDPMILATGSGYLAVGTNNGDGNVPTLSSPDLVHWTAGSDALPQLPVWTEPGDVWAPEVSALGAGRFALYFTSRDTASGRQCVGVAVAARPIGPYAAQGAGPLVCQRSRGGSIDAHPFTAADGRRFLYWKNDGNAVGQDSWLWVQRLSDDGLRLTRHPTRLFTADLSWEGALVEAPFVVEQGGRFHLFYSANAYDSAAYAVGHAVADDPSGPYVKDDLPVLATDDAADGPGHCALIRVGGSWWMAYHAWPPGRAGDPDPGRTLWLSRVDFHPDGGVTVQPPLRRVPGRP